MSTFKEMPENMSAKATLAQVNKCLFTIAKPAKVDLNKKSRLPAYLLSLKFSPELLNEHHSLYKKDLYSSSAQLTNQHTAEELESSLLLTLINFPRKQIGPKMSDCLVCGVLPFGPEVDPQFKRDNTVFIRPFLNNLAENLFSAQLFGAPVGVFPTLDGSRHTNPRDLTWSEFETVDYLVGTVQELHANTESARADGLLSCDGIVDFGLSRGILKSRVWLRSESVQNGSLLEELKGRQVIAVTNLDTNGSRDLFDSDTAAILTVNGYTTIEPAKEVENGFRLA